MTKKLEEEFNLPPLKEALEATNDVKSDAIPDDIIEEETLADCLGGGIGLDNKYTFEIAKKYIDDFSDIVIASKKITDDLNNFFF